MSGFIERVRRGVTERVDGWVNAISGVGDALGRNNFGFTTPIRRVDQELDDLYYGDAMAAAVSNAVPEEGLRRGFTFKAKYLEAINHTGHIVASAESAAGVSELEAASRISHWFDLNEIPGKAMEAWTWARRSGGAAWVLGCDDGLDPCEPLDLNRLRSIDWVSVVSKRELIPTAWYTNPRGKSFGEPMRYQLQQQGAINMRAYEIHASRIIRWDGALTDRLKRFQNNGWSESELQRVYTNLQRFNGAYAAVGMLLQEASVGVLKMRDLMGMMANDNQDVLKKRIAMMDMCRSVAHAVLLDAEGESFDRTEVSFAGLPDLLDRFAVQFAGAARIPVTILMGQAPAGLNATGDSDVRMFYGRVSSARLNYLKPRLLKLAAIVCAASNGPTRGVVPRLDVVFPSMFEASPSEDADIKLKTAQTDQIYVTIQAVTPEEVATSRWRPEGYSTETTIDLDTRSAMMGADAAAAPSLPAGSPPANDIAPPAAAVSDLAMNGAQVTSLQGIVTAAAANQLPAATAREIIGAAFPELAPDRIERMLAPIAGQSTVVSQHAELQADHAKLQRSHASLKSTLKRLIAKFGVKGSPVAIGGSGAGVSDADIDAAVAEVEDAEQADASGSPSEGSVV